MGTYFNTDDEIAAYNKPTTNKPTTNTPTTNTPTLSSIELPPGFSRITDGPSGTSGTSGTTGGFRTTEVTKRINTTTGEIKDTSVGTQTRNSIGNTVPPPPSVDAIVVRGTSTTTASSQGDLRVRLKAPTGREKSIYGPKSKDNILSILHQTNGILFPYTPVISYSQDVGFRPGGELVHANGDIQVYNNTASVSLGVTAKFTAQNQREARYLVAVMHFFKTVSKMHFGETDDSRGLPPPSLILNGYGSFMFNNLRCIVKSSSYSLEDSVDYVRVEFAGGVAKVPTMISMSFTLIQQNTPREMRKDFNLDKFRTGELMRNGGGWI